MSLSQRAILGYASMGVVALATAGTILYGASKPPSEENATVVRVVDGDTIDVLLDHESIRVRLLNIDTPETKHPNQIVECMGPEATDFLSELLPQGTDVVLEYDEERKDRYGRHLAGVFHQGELVNAEIAAQGLGGAVIYEPNHKFYEPVKAAEETARQQQRGLFDPEIECTLPSQLADVQEQVDAADQPLPESVEDTEDALDALSPLEDLVSDLSIVLDSDDADLTLVHAGYQPVLEQFKQQLDENRDSIEHLQETLEDHRTELELEEERRKAEEERKRQEAEEERKRQEAEAEAEEQRRAEAEAERQRQAEQQQRQHTPPAPPSTPPTSGGGSGSSGSTQDSSRGSTSDTPSNRSQPNPPQRNQAPSGYGTDADYPGYTGPRCYAPGGVYWKPC